MLDQFSFITQSTWVQDRAPPPPLRVTALASLTRKKLKKTRDQHGKKLPNIILQMRKIDPNEKDIKLSKNNL